MFSDQHELIPQSSLSPISFDSWQGRTRVLHHPTRPTREEEMTADALCVYAPPGWRIVVDMDTHNNLSEEIRDKRSHCAYLSTPSPLLFLKFYSLPHPFFSTYDHPFFVLFYMIFTHFGKFSKQLCHSQSFYFAASLTMPRLLLSVEKAPKIFHPF